MSIIFDFAGINARLTNGFREPVAKATPPAAPATIQSTSNFYQALASASAGRLSNTGRNSCHTHTLTQADLPCHTHSLTTGQSTTHTHTQPSCLGGGGGLGLAAQRGLGGLNLQAGNNAIR